MMIYKYMIYRCLGALLVSSFLLFTSCSSRQEDVENSDDSAVSSAVDESNVADLGFDADSLDSVEGKVRNGQYFSSLLSSISPCNALDNVDFPLLDGPLSNIICFSISAGLRQIQVCLTVL